MRRWGIINALLGLIVALLLVQIAGTWARSLPKPDGRRVDKTLFSLLPGE